jgi:hypothetical protein
LAQLFTLPIPPFVRRFHRLILLDGGSEKLIDLHLRLMHLRLLNQVSQQHIRTTVVAIRHLFVDIDFGRFWQRDR